MARVRKPRYKHPPGEWVEIDWDIDPPYYAVYGHVDRETFALAMQKQGIDFGDSDALDHGWMKMSPDPSRDHDCLFERVDGPGAGRFPVTILRVWVRTGRLV